MEDNQQTELSMDVEPQDMSTTENTQPEIMIGLPPIDIHELAKVLLDPNMPAQKIMKEVADHMVKKVGEIENSSSAGDGLNEGTGMKNVMDCIIEVCMRHEDSDKSDEEDDDYEEDEKIIREIPCKFCDKIFNSNMACKTHVLVAHPQEDPSVSNLKYLSEKEARKKSSSRRKSSRCSSKTESDSKVMPPPVLQKCVENEPLCSLKHSHTELRAQVPCLSHVSSGNVDAVPPGNKTSTEPEAIVTCDKNHEVGCTCSTVSERITSLEQSQEDYSQSASKHKRSDSVDDSDSSVKKSRTDSSNFETSL